MEESDPAFKTANAVSPALKGFFQRTVAAMVDTPFRKWSRLWAEAPDPTCAAGFDPETTAAWEEQPIFFYSPSDKWPQLGIRTPCARFGWDHVDSVTVFEKWHLRLGRGIFSDTGLAGKLCRCKACRKEHDQIKKQYDAALRSGADATALKVKLKAASFNFSTIDSRVVRFWFERVPWVAIKMPFFVTARAAVSVEMLWMILRAFPKGQAVHDMEAMFREFKSLRATCRTLEFYSYQRTCMQHPSLNQAADWSPLHLHLAVSSMSDTFINHILEEFYDGPYETYMLQWFEQRCPFDIALTDHHGKYSSRMMQSGDRLLPWWLKGMNSWGGLPMSVAVQSTSYNDITAVRAFDNYNEAAVRTCNIILLEMCTCDSIGSVSGANGWAFSDRNIIVFMI